MLSLGKVLKDHISSSTTALIPLVTIDGDIFLSTKSIKFDGKNFEPYLTKLPKMRQSINIREKTFKINTLSFEVDNSHEKERKFSNRFNLMDKYNTEIKVYMYCAGMKTLAECLLVYNAKIQKVVQSANRVIFHAEDTVTYNLDQPIELKKIGDLHENAPTKTKAMPITFGANYKAKAYIVDSTWQPIDQSGGESYDAIQLKHTILADERGKVVYGFKSTTEDLGIKTNKLDNDDKSVDWAGEPNHLFIWADDYWHRVSPMLYGSEYSDEGRQVDFKGTSTGQISEQTLIESDAIILKGTTTNGVTVEEVDGEQIFEYDQDMTDEQFSQLSPVIRLGAQCTAIRTPSKVNFNGNWLEIPEEEGSMPDDLTVRKSNPNQSLENTMGDNNPETGVFWSQFGTDGFPKANFQDVFQASANLTSDTYGSEPLSPTDIGHKIRQLPADVYELNPNSPITDEFANTLSHNLGLSFTFENIGSYDCFSRIKASLFLCNIINRDGRFSHPSSTMANTLNSGEYSLTGNPDPIRWDVMLNDGVNSAFMGVTGRSSNHPHTQLANYKSVGYNSVCWNTFYKAGGAELYGTNTIASGINAYNGGDNWTGTGDSPFIHTYNDDVYGIGVYGNNVSQLIENKAITTNSLTNINLGIRTKAFNVGSTATARINNIYVWGWCNAFTLLQNYVVPNILRQEIYAQVNLGRQVSLNGNQALYTDPLAQIENVLNTFAPNTGISHSHPLNGFLNASNYLKNDGWITDDELTGYSYQISKKIPIKKYIQSICEQSPLIPYINTSENKIGFNVLKAIYPDSEYFKSETQIKNNDILSYKASLTPRLDQLVKEVKVDYNFNPSNEPLSSYPSDGSYFTAEDNIKTQDGTGEVNSYSNEYYNSGLSKTIEAKYVKSEITAKKIAENYLKLHANQRIELKIKLGLKYLKLEVGDIVWFDENIDGEMLFHFDLTKNNQVVNGQQYFRYFIITEKITSLSDVSFTLNQLTNTSASNEYGETFYLAEDYVYGCTNPSALNYVPTAQYTDYLNPCQFAYGCNDPNALNYNESIGLMNNVWNNTNQHWENIDLYLDRLGLNPDGVPTFLEDNSLCLYAEDVPVQVSVASNNTMTPPISTSGNTTEFELINIGGNPKHFFRVVPESTINSTFLNLLNGDALPNGVWVHHFGGEVIVSPNSDQFDAVYQPTISYQTPAINYEINYILWDGESASLSEPDYQDVQNFGLNHVSTGSDITFNFNPFQSMTAQQVIDLFNPQIDGSTAIENLPFIKKQGDDFYIYYRLGRQLNYTLSQQGQNDINGTTGMNYGYFYVKFTTNDLQVLYGTGNVISDGSSEITANDFNCMLEIIQLYAEGNVNALQNACNNQSITWGNAFNPETGQLLTIDEINELYISPEEIEEEQEGIEQFMAENCFLLSGNQQNTFALSVQNNLLDCQTLSSWQGVEQELNIAPNANPNYHVWEFSRVNSFNPSSENVSPTMLDWCRSRYPLYTQNMFNFDGLPLNFQGSTPLIIVVNRSFFEGINRFDEYFPNNILNINGSAGMFMEFYKNLSDVPSDINPLGGTGLANQLRLWLDPENPSDSDVYNKFYKFCSLYLGRWWNWENNDDYQGINPSAMGFYDGTNDLSQNLYEAQPYFNICPIQFGGIAYNNPYNVGQPFGESGETEFDINVADVKLQLSRHIVENAEFNIQDRYLDVFVGLSYTYSLPHQAFNSIMGNNWIVNLQNGNFDFLEIGEELAQNCYSFVENLNTNLDHKGKYFSLKQIIVDNNNGGDGNDEDDDDDDGGIVGGKNMVKPDYKDLIKSKIDSQDVPQSE